jgi:hypothetical protein
MKNKDLNPREGVCSDGFSPLQNCSRRINQFGGTERLVFMKTKTSATTNSMSRSLLQRGVLLIPLVIAAKRKVEHDHTVGLFE